MAILNHMPAREVTKRIKDAGCYISKQVVPESNGAYGKYEVYYTIHDCNGDMYDAPIVGLFHDRLWEAREFAIRAVIAGEIGYS